MGKRTYRSPAAYCVMRFEGLYGRTVLSQLPGSRRRRVQQQSPVRLLSNVNSTHKHRCVTTVISLLLVLQKPWSSAVSGECNNGDRGVSSRFSLADPKGISTGSSLHSASLVRATTRHRDATGGSYSFGGWLEWCNRPSDENGGQACRFAEGRALPNSRISRAWPWNKASCLAQGRKTFLSGRAETPRRRRASRDDPPDDAAGAQLMARRMASVMGGRICASMPGGEMVIVGSEIGPLS